MVLRWCLASTRAADARPEPIFTFQYIIYLINQHAEPGALFDIVIVRLMVQPQSNILIDIMTNAVMFFVIGNIKIY